MGSSQLFKSESKSFLRWAGSKKKLLPILSKQIDFEYNKYIEPFVGSAQLFFAVNPCKAILSDTNSNLIDCYLAVKENAEKVYEHLISFPLGKEAYYKIRNIETKKWSVEKKAAQFIYLNIFCFNGLYRTNKKGEFNVPYSDESSKVHTREHFHRISESLKNASFLVGDFEEVVKSNVELNDFVYLDPPYAVKNKEIFIQYGATTFGLSDLKRLDKTLEVINEQNATFLLSYAHCEEALFLAKNWNYKIVTTVRNISGFAKYRKRENEILISNKTFNG